MSDYIRRSDALRFALFCIRNIFDSNVSLDDKFKEIPSADVTELKNGKWSDKQVAYIDEYGDLHFGYKCSACGAILSKTNYCGACGAKMRETDE